MGALEFQPAKEIGTNRSIELDELYRKAREILEKREEVVIDSNDLSLNSLYEVGTSAGGQHTKTVIARNNATGEIRSGQILLPPEYTYYILKFAEPDYMPLTVVEYIYNRMAANAGIDVMPCELLSIDGAQHFLTERFDRKDGRKIHIQSLAAMNPEANSYEDLMWACEDLGLPYSERRQMYMRMVFNILTTNVDAHVKNFSFMLEEGGEWHITPAYDLTFSCFNPGNRFDPAHSLSVCGKYMNIGKDDLIDFGKRFGIRDTGEIIDSISDAVMRFRSIAEELELDKSLTNRIEQHFAEMNPEILSSLSGYKPSVYSYFIEGKNIKVEDAQWTEMNNGAMRLTATLNGTPFRATFAKNSEVTKTVIAQGGTAMPLSCIQDYVTQYFLPKYEALNR